MSHLLHMAFWNLFTYRLFTYSLSDCFNTSSKLYEFKPINHFILYSIYISYTICFLRLVHYIKCKYSRCLCPFYTRFSKIQPEIFGVVEILGYWLEFKAALINFVILKCIKWLCAMWKMPFIVTTPPRISTNYSSPQLYRATFTEPPFAHCFGFPRQLFQTPMNPLYDRQLATRRWTLWTETPNEC